MLYSILIYGSEAAIDTLTDEEEGAIIAKHKALQDHLRESGRLGPFARLMPTTAAVTLRAAKTAPVLLDGPFAETKEQLLGFYFVECATLEEAVATARMLPIDPAAMEVRPVRYYERGVLAAERLEAAPYP